MIAENTFLTDFYQKTFAKPIVKQIVNNFKPIKFSKNDFILKEGTISTNFVLLEKGIARAFVMDPDGYEITTNFFVKESFIFEIASFFKQKPSNENIQTITDCVGWRCHFDDFQNLFHTLPEFREYGRNNLVNGFIALKERNMAMIKQSAETRYLQLLSSKPEIIQNVPLKYIASFLGITDTSLSRIRKELTKN